MAYPEHTPSVRTAGHAHYMAYPQCTHGSAIADLWRTRRIYQWHAVRRATATNQWQMHCRFVAYPPACPWQDHGTDSRRAHRIPSLSYPWRRHGTRMAEAQHANSIPMADAWPSLADPWQTHGRPTACPWHTRSKPIAHPWHSCRSTVAGGPIVFPRHTRAVRVIRP